MTLVHELSLFCLKGNFEFHIRELKTWICFRMPRPVFGPNAATVVLLHLLKQNNSEILNVRDDTLLVHCVVLVTRVAGLLLLQMAFFFPLHHMVHYSRSAVK